MEAHEWVELEQANAKSWWEDRKQAAGVDLKLFSPLLTFIPLQCETFVDNKLSCGCPAGLKTFSCIHWYNTFKGSSKSLSEPTFISLRNVSVYRYINTVDLQTIQELPVFHILNRKWKNNIITLPNHRRQQSLQFTEVGSRAGSAVTNQNRQGENN